MIGKDASVTGKLAQTHVQGLNRIGGVNHLADFGLELEERDHIAPVAVP